jgi:hypothetical protein
LGSGCSPFTPPPNSTRAWCSPTRRDITIDATIDAQRAGGASRWNALQDFV